MELKHEEKQTPTFRQFARKTNILPESRYDIERVFANSTWRTITIVTSEFRINFKFASEREYNSKQSSLGKILTKYCQAYVIVYDAQRADVTVIPASDADEQAVRFESDDFGWVRVSAKSPA